MKSKDSLQVRPAAIFSSPSTILTQTFLRNRTPNLRQEKVHLYHLISKKKLEIVEEAVDYKIFNKGNIQLVIEVHHEFICYVWILEHIVKQHEIDDFLKVISEEWINTFPGKLLNQSHIYFDKKSGNIEPKKRLEELFGNCQIIGNYVENEAAKIWTDFNQDNKASFLKFHVEDISLGPRRTGRLAQNIIDLENYRNMAMLSSTIAEEITFELEEQELQLAETIKLIANTSDTNSEKKLLKKLLHLSVITEEWRSISAHRFTATDAYKKIIEDRLNELDERKFLGYQPMSKFLIRATMPTFRTCDATNIRLNIFISRIDRAVSLLSTKIRITVEEQNQELLKSANNQNAQQMVLQETVEAFSIIAISYYACSLLKTLLEMLVHIGVELDPYVWTGLFLPIIVFITFFTMKLIRKNSLKKMPALNDINFVNKYD